MTQQALALVMANAYLIGCAFALLLSWRDRDNALQAIYYVGALLAFYAAFGGEAHRYGWMWYVLNAVTDLFIVRCAIMIRARSSNSVIVFGFFAYAVDVAFTSASAGGNRFPGLYYFYASNVFVALQVGSLIIFSAGAASGWHRVRTWTAKHQKAKERPWTSHRFSPHL